MDFGKAWNDSLIENYLEWSGRFVVANIQVPKDSLITGFELHGKTAGLVSLNVRNLTIIR